MTYDESERSWNSAKNSVNWVVSVREDKIG